MPENERHVLETGCIFDKRSPQDGQRVAVRRVAVMSRLTLDDGITHDPQLEGQYDEHRPELGPASKLIGAYYKRGLPWKEFARLYTEGLSRQAQQAAILYILSLLRESPVILQCVEEDPKRCHRRLLAEYIEAMGFGVRVEVR